MRLLAHDKTKLRSTVLPTVSVNNTVRYRISQQGSDNKARGSLIDGGANGGSLGGNVRILEHVPNSYVSITGVAGNKITNLKLAKVAALVDTMADGPVILIMLQYANYGVGQTVHLKGQMEHFGLVIDDKSRNAGGKQCIITPEGHTIPIHVRDGLPRMDMRIPTVNVPVAPKFGGIVGGYAVWIGGPPLADFSGTSDLHGFPILHSRP